MTSARSTSAACGSTATSRSSPRCRTGGFKKSGYGKDLSMYGFEDYTRVKHVMSYLGE
jgi:acyl-CoA reductase-like NAD-dependent aldehyde dehydrogenase